MFQKKHHILPVRFSLGILTVEVHLNRLFGSSIRVLGTTPVLTGGLLGQIELQPTRLVLLDL